MESDYSCVQGFFCGAENVLELHYSDDCTNLVNILNVNDLSIKLFNNNNNNKEL